jgi:hypothetical protein
MVSVRFAQRTLSLALPQASDFAPMGYPGLMNRPKWQRGTPKTLCSTKFRHDSEYILKTPPEIMGISLPIKVPWGVLQHGGQSAPDLCVDLPYGEAGL